MYIKEIKLTNVRGFHGSRDVTLDLTRPDGSLAGWTVLAGRNGSGKTSLLRAMALAVGGAKAAAYLVGDFGRWLTAGESSGMLLVRVAPDEDEDRLARGTGRITSPFWAGLTLDLPSEERRGRSDAQPMVGELPEDDEYGDRHVVERGLWNPNSPGWFCAGYGPFRRLVGTPVAAERPSPGNSPAGRLVSLFDESVSLAEGVGWLIEQHLRALEGRTGAEELKGVAMSVLGDGLLPDGFRVQEINSDGLWVERDGHSFPLREMSDGYRTVVALVVDLLKRLYDCFGRLDTKHVDGSLVVTAPGVVLIDEVDAHLHVSWQKRIGDWLKRHFPRIQFIVTTHSPYICQAADERGLIRLPGADEDEPPRIVDQDLYERIIYGSGDDAIVSDLFGLDTPYSEAALRLRRELVELETDVLLGHASEADARRYEALRDRLSSSPAAQVEELAARITLDAKQRRT